LRKISWVLCVVALLVGATTLDGSAPAGAVPADDPVALFGGDAGPPPAGPTVVEPDPRGVLGRRYFTVDRHALLGAFVVVPITTPPAPGQRSSIPGRPVTVEGLGDQIWTFEPTEVTATWSLATADDQPAATPTVEWHGRHSTPDGAVATGTFTLAPDARGGYQVTGLISNGATSYRVQPLDGDRYGIYAIDPNFQPAPTEEAGEPLPAPAPAPAPGETTANQPTPPAPPAVPAGAAPAGAPIIDVLVAYTTDTPASAVAFVPQAIAETNSAFSNSGRLPQRVRLAGTIPVAYSQYLPDMNADLVRLQRTGDGFMDSLHTLRNAYYADLVVLIVPRSNAACGIGYLSGRNGSASYGFSVVAAPCLNYAYTFTHELGHNLGAHHNPEHANGGCSPTPSSCGHWVNGVARDVMTYGAACSRSCPVALQFSNPSVDFLGRPGLRSGTSSRNNATSLKTVAPYAAAYRPPPPLAPGAQSAAWTHLGARGVGSASGVSWGPGRYDVFVTGPDLRLWHRWWETAAGWSAWEPLGGRLGSGPSASVRSPGRLDVVARGVDGHAYHLFYDRGRWSQWTALGGNITGSPTGISWNANRYDVFVTGTDGQLWHRGAEAGRGWSAWIPRGGRLGAGPSASSRGYRRLDVVARGVDGHVYQLYYDQGRWSQWTALGGNITGSPAGVSWSSTRYDVFATGVDGQLWHRFAEAGHGWSAWEPLGGWLNAGPSVSTWGEGHFDVVALATDDAVIHAGYENGEWSAG
jgi:hypothetical protein